jgi:hypothetical protein
MVPSFAKKTVDEITTPKGSSNQRCNPFAITSLNLHLVSNVRKDTSMAQRDKGQFAEVRMSGEILKSMELWKCQRLKSMRVQ